MTATQAMEYIHGLHTQGTSEGLAHLRTLLPRLGNPQNALQYVHIAGSNGKGSTAAMTAAVLRAAGLRCGLYTSPYIHRFHERVQVNGVPIPDEALARLTERVMAALLPEEALPNEFEFITALAFCWFLEQQCDIVVLEVGLGGTKDPTNVILPPLVAAVCNIGLEHTALLGDTLAQIAAQKAGIIKPGCGCAVLYPQQPQVNAVLQQACEQAGCPYAVADFSKLTVQQRDLEGQRFCYRDHPPLQLALLGENQLCNAAMALEIIAALQRQGRFAIPLEAVAQGLATARWPGRFELLQQQPAVVVDGGHNPQCIESAVQNLRLWFGDRRMVFVLGLMADKDYDAMLTPLLPLAVQFFTVAPQNPRALSAEELAARLTARGARATPCRTVPQALQQAVAACTDDMVCCALGSLYMVGEIRAFFGRDSIEDPM